MVAERNHRIMNSLAFPKVREAPWAGSCSKYVGDGKAKVKRSELSDGRMQDFIHNTMFCRQRRWWWCGQIEEQHVAEL